MKISQKNCIEFVEALSSKEAVPGGGGAAALVGSIGMALGSMVCNLTIGKNKYKEYEDDIKEILSKANKIEKDLLDMIDEDAKCFLPLANAYKLPKSTCDEIKIKEEAIQKALKLACEVPIDIVKTCYEAIKLHEELVDKGSRLALSDIGVGIQCLRAALLSAQLNVLININSIKDKEYVKNIRTEVDELVSRGIQICDSVYSKVEIELGK